MELNAFRPVSRAAASHRSTSLNLFKPLFLETESKEKQNDCGVVLNLVCCAFMVAAQCLFHSYPFDSQAALKQC